MKATVIGAGLAGSEASWQLAERGVRVSLLEMRPLVSTKAHQTARAAELVCSNSFRGASLSNAVGLLKAELSACNSLIMRCAYETRVPAGGALGVDRERFSAAVDEHLLQHPNITRESREITSIPPSSFHDPVILATGPLTSRPLAESIEKLSGAENLAFFDAISPILFSESIDHSVVFRQSRYDKGEGADYLNIPLNQEEYEQFCRGVLHAEKYTGNEAVENDSLDKLRPFEGCMPIEDMVERGPDTLRYGPFKPMGLRDPRTGKRPYAVCQLRQDDTAGTLWSLVGMQTRMKRHEQERIFRSLPGLSEAEFVRYGSVHRNTFIESPKCLDATLLFRGREGLFFAGQITGVEGYVESTAGGLVAGINCARLLTGKPPLTFPTDTAIGALLHYISSEDRKQFQPMNISFGLFPCYSELPTRDERGKKIPKKEIREGLSKRALVKLSGFLEEAGERDLSKK